MPIYEYYCAACNGRFRHLARRFDAPSPACPRCGCVDVTRMISTVNVVRGEAAQNHEFEAAAKQVDGEDPQAIARFLQASGRLDDATGVYGSKAYRELIARRAAGATEVELADLVDDLSAQMHNSEATEMAGAVMFADRVENRMQAEGPPERDDHEEASVTGKDKRRSGPRAAQDLGWG